MMVDTTDELKQVIASFVTDSGEVEVARISHSNIDTLHITGQLENDQALVDENSAQYNVLYVPMSLSDESSGELINNSRKLTLQGINDLVATEEDKIPENSTEKVKVDILSYIADLDGNLSTVAQGPYRYFLQTTEYSQAQNACALSISTTPTNNSRTGQVFSKAVYETLAGFE